MKKTRKFTMAFLFVGLICLGFIFACQGKMQNGEPDKDLEANWIVMDEFYEPRNRVEEFIYIDADSKGLLPVSIMNYGKDKKILKSFRGKNFAGPSEAQIRMMFKGLEDWMILDIKYSDEREREVLRTVLYVYSDGNWRVGDSGSLVR